jgi:U3 small nucleolar RNA-associated protein 10
LLSFFAHLVDVLGASDFLAPMCMLLVSKVATRVVKQEIPDVQTTLALPTSILHRHSPKLQVEVLSEVLEESRRLVASVSNPDRTGAVFLNDPRWVL